MKKNNLSEIANIFRNSDNFLLSTHIHPDGDGIGAEIALGLGLRKLKKDVIVINSDPIPENYCFLPSEGLLKDPGYLNSNFDVGVSIECSDLDRAGKIVKQAFLRIKNIVNIDHHPGNGFFGTYNYVVTSASAVGEQVYDLLKALKIKFDKNIAECIYTSILTDTGSFAYSNTTKRTHEVVVDLLKYDINPTEIYQNVYEVSSLGKIQLLGATINSLEVDKEKGMAWITITRETFKSTGTSYDDAEGLINYARSIKGVKVALSFTEISQNKIKVSFRSKVDDVNVNEIAASFNGGGHRRASGALLEGDLNEVKDKVLSRMFEYIAKGNNKTKKTKSSKILAEKAG